MYAISAGDYHPVSNHLTDKLTIHKYVCISDEKKLPETMAQWGYDTDNGPSAWGRFAPIVAYGKKQSPVDIVCKDAKFTGELGKSPIKVSYSSKETEKVINNGHSVQVAINGEESSLTGGPLSVRHKLVQFHFHWGNNSSVGSEHVIDGKSYAAELHLVHYSTKFPSFGDAVQASGGLAVLGIFLEIGDEHPGLKKLTDLMPKVTDKDQSVPFEGGFDPSCLLPEDTTKYWTYSGSLTTPPCYESVTWIVFKEPIKVSEEQMNCFRKLRSACKTSISDNYRPVCLLNDRKIYSSWHHKFFAE